MCHLVGVEDDGLFRVVLLHYLNGDPGDGGLEVGLLSVHHAPPGSLDCSAYSSVSARLEAWSWSCRLSRLFFLVATTEPRFQTDDALTSAKLIEKEALLADDVLMLK